MDWGECGLGRCAIVGRIPYWGCKSNLCGADLEGGGASNLTGADRGRLCIGAVRPASPWGMSQFLTESEEQLSTATGHRHSTVTVSVSHSDCQCHCRLQPVQG